MSSPIDNKYFESLVKFTYKTDPWCPCKRLILLLFLKSIIYITPWLSNVAQKWLLFENLHFSKEFLDISNFYKICGIIIKIKKYYIL